MLQVSLTVFSVYVLSSSDNYLDPQKAFVSLSIIDLLNWATSFLPILLASLAQVMHCEFLQHLCFGKQAKCDGAPSKGT